VSGDGRNLSLVPAPDDQTVWVPIVQLPWRDDEQDRIQPTDIGEAS
jgi:hypothetical protein